MDYQAERDKITDQQWQQQFDESVRQFNESQKKKSSSSSGGSSKKTTTTTDPTTTTPPSGMTWSQFMNSLGGDKTSSSLGGVVGAVAGAASTIAGAIGSAVSNTAKKNTTTVKDTVKKPASGAGNKFTMVSVK